MQISASGDGEEEEEEEKEENDVLRKEGTATTTSQRNTKTKKPESHLLRRDILNEFRKPLVVKKGDAKRAFDRRIDAAIGVLSTLNERTALLEKTPAKSRSTCVTRGVRVTASSSLILEQSSPREQRFVYDNVRIENESMTEPVQLISRRFEITDENGGKEFVDGHGVIGKQPILDVGEKFEYTSAVPLKHLKGQMTGGYLMASQRTGTVFEAKLESFALKPQELKKAREEEKDAEASKVATTTTGKGRRSRVM